MSTIRDRLEVRAAVLRLWAAEEVPRGRDVPKSKNDLMAWEDQKLGIERIGHRNACTTTHPQNGPLIRECLKLMAELGKRRPRARPGIEADNKRLRQKLRQTEDRIVQLVNQWHAARAEAESLGRDIAALQAQLQRAREEIARHKREALKVVELRPS